MTNEEGTYEILTLVIETWSLVIHSALDSLGSRFPLNPLQ
jgi:hypothetical protein